MFVGVKNLSQYKIKQIYAGKVKNYVVSHNMNDFNHATSQAFINIFQYNCGVTFFF